MQTRVLAIVVAIASSAVASSAIPAGAADMRMPAPIAVPPSFSWNGFYLGAHGGHGWGHARPAVAETPTQHPDGWFGGVQAGVNHQFASNVVLGAEVDVSFGRLTDSVTDGPFLTQTSKIDHFGTARLRLGYGFDRVLPYVTGGIAWVHGEGGMSCASGAPVFSICGATGPFALTDTTTSVGWTVGGGIEYAFADNWSAKAEYLYADLGNTTLSFTLPVAGLVSGDVSQTLNVVRIGVNYRFGGTGPGPY